MPPRTILIKHTLLMWMAAFCVLPGCTEMGVRQGIHLPALKSYPVLQTIEDTNQVGLNKLSSILKYEQHIHSLHPEELELERGLLETSLDSATDVALVKLALLYYHEKTSFRNSERAQEILESCMLESSTTSVEVRSFSTLVVELLDENKDQQRTLKLLQRQLDKERNERKKLKEQLDALKAIEEIINNRSNSLTNYSKR